MTTASITENAGTSHLTTVMIDSREPPWIQELQFHGVLKAVTQLPHGDLWAATDDGEMLLVERKTPSDLLASVKDGRLFHQLAGMRERSPWCYVVITGIIESREGFVVADGRLTGWTWSSLQGVLLDVQESGVHIIYCASAEDYAGIVALLDARKRDRNKVLPPVVEAMPMSAGERILTSLPGIGLGRARILLDEFGGNPAYAVQWLTWPDTFQEVAGIGNGIKDGVRSALRLHDEEWLSVFSPEAVQYFESNRSNSIHVRN